jgi:hypothetical protein
MFSAGVFLMLIAVGAVPVIGQLVDGGRWDAAPCLGLLYVFFATTGLIGRALEQRHRRRMQTIPTTPASPGLGSAGSRADRLSWRSSLPWKRAESIPLK